MPKENFSAARVTRSPRSFRSPYNVRVRLLSLKSLVPPSAYISRTKLLASSEHLASRTGWFVRVYERPRSGFQFSPIISNGWASWQDLSRDIILSIIPLPFSFFLSLSFSFSLTSFFGLPDCRSFFKARRERTYQAHRLSGITDYVLQVLPERKRCPGRIRSPCGRRYATGGSEPKREEGFHFRDLWAHACDSQSRFHRVISSYFTLSAAASFLGISVAKKYAYEQAFPFVKRLFLAWKLRFFFFNNIHRDAAHTCGLSFVQVHVLLLLKLMFTIRE